MKLRNRIKFAIDNFCMHGNQTKSGIAMHFFSFLLLMVAILIYKMSGSFTEDIQGTLNKDISDVGYIYLSADNYNDIEDFADLLDTQDYIEYYGSVYTGSIEYFGEATDEIKEMQSTHKRDNDTMSTDYVELIDISDSLFELYDIDFYRGYMEAEEVTSQGYIPIYAGCKYRKILNVGDVIESGDGEKYMIAGFMKKGQTLPIDDVAYIDSYYINAVTSLDYSFVAVCDYTLYYSVYFSVKDGYEFDDVKYRLNLLAERENVSDMEIYNIGYVAAATDNSTKAVRKYLLELFLIVGIFTCVILVCYACMNIITEKYEFAVLYANGFNNRDIICIILIEQIIKILIAILLALPVVAVLANLYFEAVYESRQILNEIIFKDCLTGVLLMGVFVIVISMVYPVKFINKKMPGSLMKDE